jgi:hypothetical protein
MEDDANQIEGGYTPAQESKVDERFHSEMMQSAISIIKEP